MSLLRKSSGNLVDEQNNLYECKCDVVFDEYGNDFTTVFYE